MKHDSHTLHKQLPSSLPLLLGFLPLVVWFFYQTHFYATHVRIGLPPDEPHHFHLALFYKEAPGIFLTASEKTYPYGPIEYHPYLYHLVLGKLLLLNFLQIPESLLLRHVSIACSVVTLCALWALLGELRVRWPARVVAMAAITNITMFVYISSAISYDSFINMLSVVLQLYFIRALREPKWTYVLICSICLLAGSLAKVTFLPFYPILALIVVVCYRPFLSAVKTLWGQRLGARDVALASIAAILFIGNLHLYGGNYLKFRAIIPAFEQVVGEEVATTTYPQARRDKILIETRDSRLEMSLSDFLPKYFSSVLWSSYGIMGHKSFYREQIEMRRFYLTGLPAAIGGIIFLLVLLVGRDNSPREVRRAILIVFLFALLYVGLVAFDNYKSFQLVRVFGYGLQGRYLFPVLTSVIATCAFFSFYCLRSMKFGLPVAAIILGVYLKQGLWSMVERLQQSGLF